MIEIFIVDPITTPIVKGLHRMKVRPWMPMVLAFVARVLAAGLFAKGLLEAGASAAICGFFLDGMDGKLARLSKNQVRLYGMLDFVLDQVAVSLMAIGIWIHTKGLGIVSWLALYMLLMAVTSTWFRILLESGAPTHTGQMQASMGPFLRRWAISRHALRIWNWGRRNRVVLHPTSIESEVVIFYVAPFFGFPVWLSFLAAGLLLPDIVIRIAASVVHLKSKEP